jgi:hypothetical protein
MFDIVIIIAVMLIIGSSSFLNMTLGIPYWHIPLLSGGGSSNLNGFRLLQSVKTLVPVR